jgi:hypothetical protein
MKPDKHDKRDSTRMPSEMIYIGDYDSAGMTFAFEPVQTEEGIDSDYQLLYSTAFQELKRENERLQMENNNLREALQSSNPDGTLELRDISRRQAKEEITEYFKKHHGKVIYPSDVSIELNISYLLVEEIIEELLDEGQIGWAE